MKRVFILGAGFSKPAGMPLATELLPPLIQKLQHDEMQQWLDGLRERLGWLSETDGRKTPYMMNIEEIFHYAYFDAEVHRLRQHLAPVGRKDGPGTPWNAAESIEHWLSLLEDTLRDVIVEGEKNADLGPITQWATSLGDGDAVLTFNYDTLVERALTAFGKTWNHGIAQSRDTGVRVFKLHGSVDWVVAERGQSFEKLDLLFDKDNANRSAQKTGDVEEDFRLWRFRTQEQRDDWIAGRYLQQGPWKTVGIAGLGAHKHLHQIPGLGRVWANAMTALYEADVAVIVGFSMSNFDAMAQIQFAEVARHRNSGPQRLRVVVVDPFIGADGEERFRRVFRQVQFEKTAHEKIDWTRF